MDEEQEVNALLGSSQAEETAATDTAPSSQSQAGPSSAAAQPPDENPDRRPAQTFQHKDFRRIWGMIFLQSIRDLLADSRLDEAACAETAADVRGQLSLMAGSASLCLQLAEDLYDVLGRSTWQPIAASKSAHQLQRYSSASLNFTVQLTSADSQEEMETALFAALQRRTMVVVPEPSRRLFTSLLCRSLFDVAMLCKADRMGSSLRSEMAADLTSVETNEQAVLYVTGYCGMAMRRGCLRFRDNAAWSAMAKVSAQTFSPEPALYF